MRFRYLRTLEVSKVLVGGKLFVVYTMIGHKKKMYSD